MIHVPYKGSGQSVQELIGGQVPMVFGTTTSMITHHRSGRLRMLAVFNEKRSAVEPSVPTAIELGVPDAVAEELAQESLLRLWLRAADFDPAQGALSTWLYRIARNLHIDRIRRERAWMQVQAAVEDAATLDVIERSSAEQFADQARLRQRINELPAVQARLVRMSYFEAKSHSEIAEAIGMPLGTVKSHLRRAFLQLQAKVGGAL